MNVSGPPGFNSSRGRGARRRPGTHWGFNPPPSVTGQGFKQPDSLQSSQQGFSSQPEGTPKSSFVEKAHSKGFKSSQESMLKEEQESRQKALESLRNLKKSKQPQQPNRVPVQKQPQQPAPLPRQKVVRRVEPQTDSAEILCSKEEASRRERSHNLSIFEMKPGTDLTQEEPQVHFPWAVKEYLRSNADQVDFERSPQYLTQCLNYLFEEILDIDTTDNPKNYTLPTGQSKHEFKEIYSFLSNRLRAVAKDYKRYESDPNDQYVYDHERIARFFLLSASEGYESPDFDPKLNEDRIRDILELLIRAYRERNSKSLPNPNEAEFRSYYIILSCKSHHLDVIMGLKGLETEVLHSSYMKVAIEAVSKVYSGDYVKFYKICEDSPYLLSCAMYTAVDTLRIKALDSLKKSQKDLTINEMLQHLWFDTNQDVLEYLSFRNVIYNQSGEVALKQSEITKTKYKPMNAPSKVQNKRQVARKQVVEGKETFKGKPKTLPEKRKEPEAVQKTSFAVEKIIIESSVEEIVESCIQESLSPLAEETINTLTPQKPSVPQKPSTPKETTPEETTPKETTSKEIYKPPKPQEPKPKLAVPEHDQDFMSLFSTQEHRKKAKLYIKKYRATKKLVMRAPRQLLILIRWKKYVLLSKFKKQYSDLTDQQEKSFQSQFSNLSTSDNLALQRFQQLKRPKTQERPLPKVSSNEIVELLQTNEVKCFKFALFGEESIVKFADGVLVGLEEFGFFYTTKDPMGSDLVMLVGNYHKPIEKCKLVVCLVFGNEPVDLKFSDPNQSFRVIKLSEFTSKDYELFCDLVWSELCEAVKNSKGPYWSNLRFLSLPEILTIYELNFENAPVELKEKLMCRDYNGALVWVSFLNSITRHLLGTLDQLYSSNVPPSELLPNHRQYLESKTNYSKLQPIFKKLLLKQLPHLNPQKTSGKEVSAMLYKYSAKTYKFFHKKFPESAEDLLEGIDEALFTTPAVVNQNMNYIKGPWCEVFLSIMAKLTEALEKLGGSLLWDLDKMLVDNLDLTGLEEKVFKPDLTIEHFTEETAHKIFWDNLSVLFF